MSYDILLLFREYRINSGLNEVTGVQKFFDLVAQTFPRYGDDYKDIVRAVKETMETHRGGERNGGDLTISHQLSIAAYFLIYLKCRDANSIKAIINHDNPEDYSRTWSHERVRTSYNWYVMVLVMSVTKPPISTFGGDKEKRDEAFHAQLLSSEWRAILIKLVDRLHNLFTIWPMGDKKRIRKVDETRTFYLGPLAAKLIEGIRADMLLATRDKNDLLYRVQELLEALHTACEYATVESDFMNL